MKKKYELPQLPFAYDALEPVISREIMELHHKKHHNAYVNNLNQAIVQWHEAESKGDLVGLTVAQKGIHFNGGGHINHSIFWQNLLPTDQGGGVLKDGTLKQEITHRYQTLEGMIEQFNSSAAALQGSGWVWLFYCNRRKTIGIMPCHNQDALQTLVPSLVPLLGIDVWEHAYYLQYKNARPEYLKNIWKVINWKDVQQRYDHARQ